MDIQENESVSCYSVCLLNTSLREVRILFLCIVQSICFFARRIVYLEKKDNAITLLLAVKNVLVYYTSCMFCLHNGQEVSPDEVVKGHFSLLSHLLSFFESPRNKINNSVHLCRTLYDQVTFFFFLESALRLWNDPSQISLALFSSVLHCLLLQEHVHLYYLYLKQNSTGIRELAAFTFP